MAFLRLDQDVSNSSNAFTKAEIDGLNEKWGDPFLLHGVVLDQPGEEFTAALMEKCESVKNYLEALMNDKRELYEQADKEELRDDWMTCEQLQSVWNEFQNKLEKIQMLPLSPILTNFTPSKELSGSLKYHVGIQHEIGDIRLVRQEIIQSSHRERIRGYLELTYFILTISHHPKLIERMDKGSSSVIRVTLVEERLEKLLKNYYRSLHKAKRELEDQLLLQNQFHTNRFREDEFTPYTAASLEKKSGEKNPLSKMQKITPRFFDKWEDQLKKAENVLIDREKELHRNSKEAIKKLNVLKRKNAFLEEEELIEINDYKEELLQQIGVVHQEVIDSAPTLSEALSQWRKHVEAAKKKMDFLLQQIPNQHQFLVCSMLIFIILMFPFLQTWLSGSSQNGGLLYYAFLPVLLVLFTYGGFLITRRSSHKPVWKFQEDTYVYTEKIYQVQVDSQHQYNHYLNQLFQLFSLRKYHEKVSVIGEEMKETNILLRYHLVKLDEFVQVTNRLLHILQINKEQTSERLEVRIPVIRFEKSVMENPIYSPFQQMGLMKLDSHGIEVYLGSAREQYPSTYFNELDQIRIQEDKVYKL